MRSPPTIVAALVGSTLALASVLALASPAHAEFMAVKTHEVPVARLLANLAQPLGADPAKALAADATKAPIAFEVARLHALAWATARPTVTVADTPAEPPRPWFGYLPPEVEYAHLRDDTAQRSPEVERHLDDAIGFYRLGLAVMPTEGARLGLAWCLAQRSGAARAEAVTLLRAIGDKAWATEKDKTQWGMGDYGLASEAAGYLIDLLDAKTDAAEIARLAERRSIVRGFRRPITPIVVPLADDVTLAAVVDDGAAVRFDLDGSGADRAWSWIRPGRGAWLVWDPRGAGAIDSGLELFGSVTFWVFWRDGYAALAALDDDHDGVLRGRELEGLALWRDDGDGRSEPGEVVPVGAAGIVALDARADRSGPTPWVARGVTYADGRTRPTWDVIAR